MKSRNRFNRAVVATVAATATVVGGYAVVKSHDNHGGDNSDYGAYVNDAQPPLEPVSHNYDLAFRAIRSGFNLHLASAAQDIASITNPHLQARTRYLVQLAQEDTALNHLYRAYPNNLRQIDTARNIAEGIENPAVKRRTERVIEYGVASQACHIIELSDRFDDPLGLAATATAKIEQPYLARKTQHMVARAALHESSTYIPPEDSSFCNHVWDVSKIVRQVETDEDPIIYGPGRYADIERHTHAYQKYYAEQHQQLLEVPLLRLES